MLNFFFLCLLSTGIPFWKKYFAHFNWVVFIFNLTHSFVKSSKYKSIIRYRIWNFFSHYMYCLFFYNPQPRIYFIDFQRKRKWWREEGREGERGRSVCERETPVYCLLNMLWPGVQPHSVGSDREKCWCNPSPPWCALNRGQTYHILVYRIVIQPRSYPARTVFLVSLWYPLRHIVFSI